jgi:hypothetical protein
MSSTALETHAPFLISKRPPPFAQPEEPTTRLNANIKLELHTALKARAALEHATIGALIEEWAK